MATKSEKQADHATLIFRVNMEFGDLPDAKINVVVKHLRAIILKRKQERASKKFVAASGDVT